MAQRTLQSYSPDLLALLWKSVETQQPITLQFPSHGVAVNRAITIRSLIKLLRTTEAGELPESVRDLSLHCATMFVSGPGRSRVPPFIITLHAAEPDNEFSITNQLGGYVPRAWQDTQGVGVPSALDIPTGAHHLPERALTDQELFDLIYSNNRVALALLSPQQRARAEELLLIGGLQPTVP